MTLLSGPCAADAAAELRLRMERQISFDRLGSKGSERSGRLQYVCSWKGSMNGLDREDLQETQNHGFPVNVSLSILIIPKLILGWPPIGVESAGLAPHVDPEET